MTTLGPRLIEPLMSCAKNTQNKNSIGKEIYMFGKKKREAQSTKNTWVIDKQFSFCYGHRVWSQKLNADYCEVGDACCKCRHLHGHEGLVHVFLEANELERGMVTDFKHLGWLKNFLDSHIDHKFILDLNDPWFINIINAKPVYEGNTLVALSATQPLNTKQGREIKVNAVYVPGTDFLAGYELDISDLKGPEQEFYEGFFLVNFLPTSENLSKWLFECVEAKMSLINVRTKRIDWFETPKSRSSYSQN